ncbi:MAG: uracil permease [Clostridia bacterium]|nr:uracil permease [Clostridia bacterium]
MQRRVYQVDEKVPFLQALPLSFQHLFAMFGASVLVPFLFNQAAQKASGNPSAQVIDPALVLLLNGIGTLIYLFLCKGKAPAFLGSSFAFIAPASAIIASSKDVATNFPRALGGFIVAGAIFTIVALLVKAVGTKWLDVVLPPAAMGPIVSLIGLELAGTAVGMAKHFPHDTAGQFDKYAIIIALATLAVVVLGNVLFKGFFAAIPVLIGVVFGYALTAVMNIYIPGLIDFNAIINAPLIKVPTFVLPTFDISAIAIIVPAALVVISEHIGHLVVTSNIVGRDLTKDPGLHRSMLGDGLSTMLSGFTGSCPTTTYGENMGVMAITKVYSVWVIGGAAVISILISFFGNVKEAITSIPVPVMGGICMLLFGVIAASGIRMIVESKVDYSKSRNLILTAVIFIVGLGGLSIKVGSQIELKGMVLATLVGMGLSLIFYIFDKLKITNDQD